MSTHLGLGSNLQTAVGCRTYYTTTSSWQLKHPRINLGTNFSSESNCWRKKKKKKKRSLLFFRYHSLSVYVYKTGQRLLPAHLVAMHAGRKTEVTFWNGGSTAGYTWFSKLNSETGFLFFLIPNFLYFWLFTPFFF